MTRMGKPKKRKDSKILFTRNAASGRGGDADCGDMPVADVAAVGGDVVGEDPPSFCDIECVVKCAPKEKVRDAGVLTPESVPISIRDRAGPDNTGLHSFEFVFSQFEANNSVSFERASHSN